MRGCANPFRPGAGLEPPYLAGRERHLDMFDAALQGNSIGNVRNVLLYGLHGVGKTALLERFASMCRGRNFLPVAAQMRGPCDSDPARFASALKRALRASIEPTPGAEPARAGLRASGTRPGPPAVGAPGPSREAPSGRDMEEPLADHLVEHFLSSWMAVKDLGCAGAVLLLDEFHAVDDAKGGRYTLGDFLAAINEAQRLGCGYSLVLSGLPALTRNVKRGRSYAERMFKLAEVTGLAGADARKAILRPLDAAGHRFSPGLVTAAVEDAAGCPYFIQFIAHEILRRAPKNRMELRYYKPVRGEIMRSMHDDFFGRRTADLGPGEKKNTLHCMSMMPGGDMRFSAIMGATGARSGGTISAHLRSLEEKGIIYRHDRGLYKFALPLLRPYLEANRPQMMPGQGRVPGAS